METDQENRYFQYGTFGVLGLTLVVCLCYLIVFANPQLPFNPFKPPLPTRVAATLPATFTPLPTRTSTRTGTPEPTQPATNTPLPTATSTLTPRALLPTPTRLIVPTQRPPSGGFTPRPPLPTATPRPSFVLTKYVGAPNCGTWYLSGTIWGPGGEASHTYASGTHVRVIANGQTYIAIAGALGRVNPGYWEVSAGTAHAAYNGTVAIVDASNVTLLSPQYPFTLTANCTGAGAVNQVTMDFTKQ